MVRQKITSITLTAKDVAKVDKLASLNRVNRSEMIRQLIRSKRVPKLVRSKGILRSG